MGTVTKGTVYFENGIVVINVTSTKHCSKALGATQGSKFEACRRHR